VTEPQVHHAGARFPIRTDERGWLVVHHESMRWRTKAEAVKAARAAGFAPDRVRPARTHLSGKFWVLLDSDVPSLAMVLTEHGYNAKVARRAGGHRTRTFEVDNGERYITKSNGSCGRYRREFHTVWVCSCGNGGFGEDRDRASAQQRARLHREDPAGFPGQPWQGTTVSVTAREA